MYVWTLFSTANVALISILNKHGRAGALTLPLALCFNTVPQVADPVDE